MANATKPQVGRSVGHEWAVSLANSGHFYWPPTGSSDWPLTVGRVLVSAEGTGSYGAVMAERLSEAGYRC